MNVFYFVHRWPKNKEYSRSEKIISLTETLINLGHKVSLLSPDTTNPDNCQYIHNIPIQKVFVNPKKIGPSIASTNTKPDLVIFNDFLLEQMYSIFLYSKWNKCPRILEVNHLAGLENWRKKQYGILGSPFLHDYGAPFQPEPSSLLSDKFTDQELQSIKRSDYYFCGNDFICHYLRTNLKLNNYILNSMGIPSVDFQNQVADLEFRQFRHRKHFAFLGNFSNEKNIQMINALIDIIWPAIRKELPDVELHMYGAGHNKLLQTKKKDYQKNGIYIKGFLDDTQNIQRYRALLYPAQYTTGIKGAITQAFFQHTPVVTTPIGAEGLFQETCEPMFSSSNKGKVYQGFFKERTLTPQQESQKAKLHKYYSSGILSETLGNLNFGGLFNSFSYSQFSQNAIKLYTNEELWKECLLKSRTSFLKHQNESQNQVNLSFGISQVEMAVYESRRKKEYNQQWDKYIKSKEGYNKLHQKHK